MKKVKLPEAGTLGLDVNVVGRGLSGRFLVPPFSVLRTADVNWQQRKRQWISLGIKGETGRISDIMKTGSGSCYGGTSKWATQRGGVKSDGETAVTASVFDPALCEILYAWFCPRGGQVIDPFAGGSVRGIVAALMGLKYWGCELRPEQVESNELQANEITPDCRPVWICGDSASEIRTGPMSDFILSCPPYGNLEVYSKLPGDISNMSYEDFLGAYRQIIKKTCLRLLPDRFAVFVVSNFRDKRSGFYHNLVGDTITAFADAGLQFYNDAVLITAIGSMPLRAGAHFVSTRKLEKGHQNVLVFYKGNVDLIRSLFSEE